MKKLLILLADPLARFQAKGEIKPRYYNPGEVFDEVHFFSPASREIDSERVQELVGSARIVIHPLGPLYMLTGWSPRSRAARLAAEIRPDVIRAYDPGFRGALAVRLGSRQGVPSVVSVHADLDDQRRHERRWRHYLRMPAERYALSRADRVICVTRYLERYARRHGATRVDVIYNRVDLDQFADRAPVMESGDRHGVPTILSVGRQVRQKHQACLIRAVRGLGVRLTLVGDGPLHGSLRALADRLGIGRQVTFIRSMPHAQIAREYRRADVFAIATHYEGFCIPVLEAMAAGLPVVASRIGPIEEIMGDTGCLVRNEPQAFADALRTLVSDMTLRREMGVRAAERARTMDGHAMEQQESALYAGVCGLSSVIA